MKTKDFSIIILFAGIAAFGYAQYREKHAPKSPKEACERGEMLACSVQGGVERQAGHIAEAKKYYQMACDHQDNHACFFLSELKREEEVGAASEPIKIDESAASHAPATQPAQQPSPAGCSADTAGCSATTH